MSHTIPTRAERLFENDLLRRGVRQAASLRAASAAIAHAPTVDDCAAAIERAREELAHLERTADLYTEFAGRDLTREIEPQIRELPVPASWLEANIAQLVLCLASRIEGRKACATKEATVDSVRRAAEESEHVDAARAALRECCGSACGERRPVPACVAAWLRLALEGLGEDEQAAYLDALRRDVFSLGLALDEGAAFA